MSQDTTQQTATAVIEEEEEDCTDAPNDSTPWRLFGTECPKEEIVWVGRDPVSAHLVQRHRERCLVIPQHDR